jgi:Ca-activated chloride channel family protein
MAFTAPENTSLNTARPSANRPPLPTDRSRWLWLATTVSLGRLFCGPHEPPGAGTGPRRARASRPRVPTSSSRATTPAWTSCRSNPPRWTWRVSGVIADVTVVQTYRNEGQRAIEAKYVFPGSTRAAVHGMNVRLADRLITAKIREKQQARS